MEVEALIDEESAGWKHTQINDLMKGCKFE
jgi:hypothetical protein